MLKILHASGQMTKYQTIVRSIKVKNEMRGVDITISFKLVSVAALGIKIFYQNRAQEWETSLCREW